MAVADGFFDGDEDFVNQAEEAARDEFNATYDDKRERYGDPCPGCGALRYGGDCGRCMADDELDAGNQLAAAEGMPVKPVNVAAGPYADDIIF
jgi:hypothetical protein